MIVFDLFCDGGHVFEGWFGSSGDFAVQKECGLVTCPACGSHAVDKAPMAPAIGRKGNQQTALKPLAHSQEAARAGPATSGQATTGAPMTKGPMPAEVKAAIARLAEAQAKALRDSKWVGRKFAEESRKMHYGEREAQAIHGEATREEASQLIEEGIAVAPLPLPVAPPEELN